MFSSYGFHRQDLQEERYRNPLGILCNSVLILTQTLSDPDKAKSLDITGAKGLRVCQFSAGTLPGAQLGAKFC
jgi:hypothetical protein